MKNLTYTVTPLRASPHDFDQIMLKSTESGYSKARKASSYYCTVSIYSTDFNKVNC